MKEKLEVQPRKALDIMKPYSPGKPIWEVQEELGLERVIKLASNENPLGPSPKALEAIQGVLTDLHRYPDAQTIGLKRKIAEHYDLSSNQVIVTNGGDELITLVSEAFWMLVMKSSYRDLRLVNMNSVHRSWEQER